MPEARWGGDDFCYTWENLVPELDKLVLMYWGDLFTFEEIGKETGHDWWTIKQLFAAYDVPWMTIKERAKYKRETLYSMFRRLIDEQGLSLNEIYREQGIRRLTSDRHYKRGQIRCCSRLLIHFNHLQIDSECK